MKSQRSMIITESLDNYELLLSVLPFYSGSLVENAEFFPCEDLSVVALVS